MFMESPRQGKARSNPIEIFERLPILSVLGAPSEVKQMAGGYIIEKTPDVVRFQKVNVMFDHTKHIQSLAGRNSPVHLESTLTQRGQGIATYEPARACY